MSDVRRRAARLASMCVVAAALIGSAPGFATAEGPLRITAATPDFTSAVKGVDTGTLTVYGCPWA